MAGRKPSNRVVNPTGSATSTPSFEELFQRFMGTIASGAVPSTSLVVPE